MKGDFSRSTFDPSKRYSSVRMQQGRPQLDADWNEQVDIVQHAITQHLRDMIGPSGAPASHAGFTITLSPAAGGESPTALPDFRIGAGRYYVDGVMCENNESTWFTTQPDYPGATLPAEPNVHGYLVYLDIWQRDLSYIQDPGIRESALNGTDTTTRTKTVWQVKLLPIQEADTVDLQRDLALHPNWQEYKKARESAGALQARCASYAPLGNQLYRVEVREADEHSVTFTWSRENGSVAFPVVGVERLLLNRVQPETSAILSSSGAEAAARTFGTPTYGPTAAATTVAETKTLAAEVLLTVHVEGLERDKLMLQAGDWVTLEDEDIILNGEPPPLCLVEQVNLPESWGTDLRDLHGSVTLRVGGEVAQTLYDRWMVMGPDTTNRELPGNDTLDVGKRPLLRRWDQRETATTHLSRGAVRTPIGRWQELERGIEVYFRGDGSYATGDYWLLPSRSQLPDATWPARQPDGITHHYSPLALLHRRNGEWMMVQETHPIFATIPDLTASTTLGLQEIETTRANLRTLEATVAQLAEALGGLKEMATIARSHVFHTFFAESPLEIGDVVALDVTREQYVVRADKATEALVVGVVLSEFKPDTGVHPGYRVAVHGRAHCKVKGSVKIGDLLVISQMDGCACPGGLFIRPGAIIGKALEPHEPDSDEPGLIHVLVTLG